MLREPLIHFLILGALLFWLDAALNGGGDDPRTIVIDGRVDAEARQLFYASRGREPTDNELRTLRKAWLDNEVLYREGIALQVDRGDPTIRDRIIFKALSIIETNIATPEADDKILATWFESNRARYDEPMRYDFNEAVISGERSEDAARAFAAALGHDESVSAQASLRVFKARPRDNIVQSYGESFALALEKAPPGEWFAAPTESGWRTVQVEKITPARPADYAALRNVIFQDWVDASLAAQRSAAVLELLRKYTVRYEGVEP